MKKGEARNFVRSNIADAFIQGCNHHINNTTNNDYKKFLIDQIAALNKKLKDSGWSTFGVPNYVPTAAGGGNGTPTADEQKIIDTIAQGKKVLEDIIKIRSDIHLARAISWENNLNEISKSIANLKATNNVNDLQRKTRVDTSANRIITLVNEINEEQELKSGLENLEKELWTLRTWIEYLKGYLKLGRFPRLSLLNNWKIFKFGKFDEKLTELHNIDSRLKTAPNMMKAKELMLSKLQEIIAESDDKAKTDVNLIDLDQYFSDSSQTNKQGELDLGKLEKSIASGNLSPVNLLHVKMSEIYQFKKAANLLDKEFNIWADLRETIEKITEFMQTRLS